MRDEIIKNKESLIENNNAKIAEFRDEIRQKEVEVQETEKTNQRKIASLEQKCMKEVASLKSDQKLVKRELESQQSKLVKKLAQSKAQARLRVKRLNAKLSAKRREQLKIIASNNAQSQQYQQEIAGLQDTSLYEKLEKIKEEKKQTLREIDEIQDNLEANEKRVAGLIDNMSERKKAYDDRIKDIRTGYEGKIQAEKDALADKQEQIQAMKRGADESEGKAIARTMLAQKIKDNFKKRKIRAKVNLRTGDVEINFGREYFDYASAKLKRKMMRKLKKAMPVYAKSIFEDAKLARRIESNRID